MWLWLWRLVYCMVISMVEEKNEENVLKPDGASEGSLATLIDRVLDKGLVINADIVVSVADTELLGIKIRAALASFATAAQYGLQFPSGTNTQTQAWKEAMVEKESCPQCNKMVATDQLLNESCPWCGWISAKAKEKARV